MSMEMRLLQRKVMLGCFLATHVPLTVLCFYAVLTGFAGLGMVLVTALVATLIGTGIALASVHYGFRHLAVRGYA